MKWAILRLNISPTAPIALRRPTDGLNVSMGQYTDPPRQGHLSRNSTRDNRDTYNECKGKTMYTVTLEQWELDSLLYLLEIDRGEWIENSKEELIQHLQSLEDSTESREDNGNRD